MGWLWVVWLKKKNNDLVEFIRFFPIDLLLEKYVVTTKGQLFAKE